MDGLWSCGEKERERERKREGGRQRTVKLNPNTPSHATQNTVAKGNTFKTHERRNILPNVGLHTHDFNECFNFFFVARIRIYFFASLINIHTNLRFIVKQQQTIRFLFISLFSVLQNFLHFFYIQSVFWIYLYQYFWSLSSRKFPVMSYIRGSDSQRFCSYEYFQPKNNFFS